MKQYLLAAFALLCAFPLFAQGVDVDKKTGLVSVNDKPAFYLEPKSLGVLQESDYSLQNLEHKELAYLKHQNSVRYTGNGTTNVTEYLMVFTKSGNQCVITGFSLLTGIIKPMARKIVAANLVQNDAVSLEEERKFIILNHGSFVTQPQGGNVVVNSAPVVAPPRTGAPADISLKETNIYNNSELVGVFKRTEDGGITTISVYNTSDALVCKASHPNDNADADWMILSDGRTATILFNPAAPLEKLFKYLVEKGIL